MYVYAWVWACMWEFVYMCTSVCMFKNMLTLLCVWSSLDCLTVYSFENVTYQILHQRVSQFSFKTLISWYSQSTKLLGTSCCHLKRQRVVDYLGRCQISSLRERRREGGGRKEGESGALLITCQSNVKYQYLGQPNWDCWSVLVITFPSLLACLGYSVW